MQKQARDDLYLLSIKLRRAQADYDRARFRGDAERIRSSQIQLSAITSERDLLIRRLNEKMSGDALQPRP